MRGVSLAFLASCAAQGSRLSLHGVVPSDVCGKVLALREAIRPGDGYGGNRHPHSREELFGGITPQAAAYWAVSIAEEEQRSQAVAGVRSLVEAVETVRQRVQESFPAEELHLDYVQMSCRERDGPPAPSNPSSPVSMAVHADNCWRDSTGRCRHERPFFHWRTHTAHLYLHSEDFRGGEFFFAEDWEGGGRTVEEPGCGRLVAFTAGPENLHGVQAVTEGKRCVLSVWLTTDAGLAGSRQELEEASAVLEGRRQLPAASPQASTSEVRPEVAKYYAQCEEAAKRREQGEKVLEEHAQEVDGQKMTFQVISKAPQLTKIRNFLSKEEAERLVSAARPDMIPSVVFEGEALTTMDYRRSETAWLTEKQLQSADLGGLQQRIEAVTGLSLNSSEDIQVAQYSGEENGKYEPHLDWGVRDEVRRDWPHKEGSGGRIATFLIFLNDAMAGGHTAFPELDLEVRPEAGSAIFWYNLLASNGTAPGDPRTLHGGCPVLRGLKYIATSWIHEGGNEQLLRASGQGPLARDWGKLEGLSPEGLQVCSGGERQCS